MDYMSNVSKRIVSLREEKGETQQELANAIGITRQSLSRYEIAARTVNAEVLGALARHFGVSADYLLGLSDVRSTEQDMRTACEVTGLSEKAVKNIQSTYYTMAKEDREAIKDAILKNDEPEEANKKVAFESLLSKDETGKRIVVQFLESEEFEKIAHMIANACCWMACSKEYENEMLEMLKKRRIYNKEEFHESLKSLTSWTSLYKARIFDVYELVKKFVESYVDTEQEVHPDGEMEQETAE